MEYSWKKYNQKGFRNIELEPEIWEKKRFSLIDDFYYDEYNEYLEGFYEEDIYE